MREEMRELNQRVVTRKFVVDTKEVPAMSKKLGIAAISVFSLLLVFAGVSGAHTCYYIDNYAEAASEQGEAEISRMFTADTDNTDEVVCEFKKGDLVAAVTVINDWPGGVLTQNITLFYCDTEVERCDVEGIDFGRLEAGDYKLVVTTGVPSKFSKPVCELDWHTEVLIDGESWDIGGLGELEPGPDAGPETECECIYFYQGRVARFLK